MKCTKITNKRYNLHIINVDTFRSCGFQLSFKCPFDAKKSVAYSLLADILTDQSLKYPTSKYITRHMQESYILDFYGSFSRVGKSLTTYINCDYIDPKYIDDKNYLDETYKFIFEVINNPLIIDNGFDEKNFNIVKNRLLTDLKELEGNNRFLSINKAIKIFSKNEIINFHASDLIDFLKNLTKEDLYEYYNDLIKNSSIDIFVSGTTDKEIVAKLIEKYYPFKNDGYVKYNDIVYPKNRFIPKTVFDKSKYKQSSLVMIYNVNCLSMYEREFVMPFYLGILNNNGLTSKLYQNLREKNSLCYNVNTTYHERCNYLVIKSTLNIGKEKKAIRLVKKSVTDMKKKISEKEFIGAYYGYQSSLKGMLDSLSAIVRLYLNTYYAGFSSYEQKKEKFKTVTIDDVYNVARKIRLNTVYVLKGDINERNQD